MHIDLNCDLGEGFPFDAELMTLITSANISCGYHSDPAAVRPALRLARDAGVQVGAHPGFEDRANFGRRELTLSAAELSLSLDRQVRGFMTLEKSIGFRTAYIKPHGALYNMACRDDALAAPIVKVAGEQGLAVMALPGSRLEALCAGVVPFIPEGFADRRYLPDGSLVPRGRPDAFVEDPAEAVRQAEWLIRERGVKTLCVHGDNPQTVAFVRALRRALAEAGVEIRPFTIP